MNTKLKVIPSIDVSKCKTINNSQTINQIITTAFSRSINVKISPVRYYNEDSDIYLPPPPIDFLKIHSINKELSLNLIKDNLDVKVKIKNNMKLEVFLEGENQAHYFIARVIKNSQNINSEIATIIFPKTIYEIKRRDYFRFSPALDQPIRIEFNHSDITYDFSIDDISAGGLSVKCPISALNPFTKGDFIENLTIFFRKETLTILSSRIIRSITKVINKKQYVLLGFEFINIKNNIQDRLIKNIFEEHRDYLNRMHKKQ